MREYWTTRPTPHSGVAPIRIVASLVPLIALALTVACKDALVPELNTPTIPETGVINNPTRAQVAQMAIGVLWGNRNNHTDRIRDMEIIGRDAYNLDGADPRWVEELQAGTLSPGGFGARHWGVYYSNIRIAELALRSLETATSANFSDEELAGARGFINTFKALDLLYIYETHESNGLVTEVGVGVNDLKPILCEGPALTAIADVLDDAAVDLAVPEAAFSFAGVLPEGLAGFDTPATFLEFNRAIKAKVELYRGNYAQVLTELAASFLDPAAPLSLGVYHDFGTGSGDLANPFATGARTLRVHPSVVEDAEADDDRVAAKVGLGDTLIFSADIQSPYIFIGHSSLTSSVPIIRNEELILLRAEANYNLGLTSAAALQAARDDINFIRVNSGGLLPATMPTAADVLTELLKQQRYSLLWESGTRWINARRYDRIGDLALDRDDDVVHLRFPIPESERNARSGNVTCTNTP
jgi:hypothetical protein